MGRIVMVTKIFQKFYKVLQVLHQKQHQNKNVNVSATAEGLLEVIQNAKLLGEMHPGTAFGELAILYNCQRTATVKGELQQWFLWFLSCLSLQTCIYCHRLQSICVFLRTLLMLCSTHMHAVWHISSTLFLEKRLLISVCLSCL